MNILQTVKEDSCIYLEQEYAGVKLVTKWRPYTVGHIPNRFGWLNDGTDKGGLSEWFNYKGFTYVRDER